MSTRKALDEKVRDKSGGVIGIDLTVLPETHSTLPQVIEQDENTSVDTVDEPLNAEFEKLAYLFDQMVAEPSYGKQFKNGLDNLLKDNDFIKKKGSGGYVRVRENCVDYLFPKKLINNSYKGTFGFHIPRKEHEDYRDQLKKIWKKSSYTNCLGILGLLTGFFGGFVAAVATVKNVDYHPLLEILMFFGVWMGTGYGAMSLGYYPGEYIDKKREKNLHLYIDHLIDKYGQQGFHSKKKYDLPKIQEFIHSS